MNFRFDLHQKVYVKSKNCDGVVIGRIEYQGITETEPSEVYLVRHVEPHAAIAEPVVNADDLEAIEEPEEAEPTDDGEED